MDAAQKIMVLQKTYAAALAQSVVDLAAAGALDRAAERRAASRAAAPAATAAQFGVSSPEEAFTRTAEIFGCAAWRIERLDRGFRAVSDRCMLCAIAKRMGAPSPCRIACTDPLAGMVRPLRPGARVVVEETLFDGARCAVRVEE